MFVYLSLIMSLDKNLVIEKNICLLLYAVLLSLCTIFSVFHVLNIIQFQIISNNSTEQIFILKHKLIKTSLWLMVVIFHEIY